MSNLSIEKFNKLSDTEKNNKYEELNEHDKYLARISMPITGKKVGKKELTKKQKEEAKEFERAINEDKIEEWFNKR